MSDSILDYPYPLNLRWNYLTWFPLYHRRYLRSRFGKLADLDVQGAALSIMAYAMDEQPPATLPLEDASILWYLRVTPEQWKDLMSREITPLCGWVKVRCGDEIRQTHPLLLEGLEVAVKANKLRQRGTTERRRGQPPDAGRAPK